MSSTDWTVALDDLLLGPTTCTGCGARPHVGQAGVYPGPTAVAYWLCAVCANQDREAVEAMLTERYSQGDGSKGGPAFHDNGA